ncbi:MAG: hypothetical protein LBQ12_09790 [Deltaproteobacteria bacterium]|nr:hypothetical protein [Deltaproteobacteria bacterium]
MALAVPRQASAQPDPLVVYRDTGHVAAFCGYQASESGDDPDTVYMLDNDLASGEGRFVFNPSFADPGDWDRISRVKTGTLLKYNLSVVYSYLSPELGGDGGMETRALLEAFELESPGDADLCETNISVRAAYSHKTGGYFCGNERGASSGGDAGVALIGTRSGVFRMKLSEYLPDIGRMQNFEIGEPVIYRVAITPVFDENANQTSPPSVEIMEINKSGAVTDSSACKASN